MNKRLLFAPAFLVAVGVLLIWSTSACKRQAPPATPESSPAPEPHTIVQIHFAGAANISSDPNSSFFTNEFCSAEAVALESQTLDKLSHAPGVWFKDKLPAGTNDGSVQLRPLLNDFLKAEWVFEMRDAPASPEYALGIRLGTNRAGIWQTNLRSLLESWTKIPAKDIPGGWELKKDLPPDLFRIVVAGDWVIAGCGQDELPLADSWAQGGKIPQSGTNWLTADLDWPHLAQIFPKLAKLDFPALSLQVIGLNSNLWLAGKFDLSQSLPPLQEWKIPTNMIHDPLTSFTAARGFSSWLTNQSWAASTDLSPAPNQAFIWSLGLMPLQTFLVIPVSDPTNELNQLGNHLTANTNWQRHLLSPFELERTPYRINLKDVPFAAPEVLALHESYGNYLFADVFPNVPMGKAPPPWLFEPFNKDHLVFYHWEKTSERIKGLPQLAQLGLLLTHHRQLDYNSIAEKWLVRIGPTAGDNVTIVTQTGPSELSFTRNAPTGFTAIELIALANWFEAPDFPGCDLNMPTTHFMPAHRPLKKLSGAAPVTPMPPATK